LLDATRERYDSEGFEVTIVVRDAEAGVTVG
jgi:hypothetical protein